MKLLSLSDLPIRRKLLFAIALTSGMTLLLAFFSIGAWQVRSYRSSLVDEAATLARIIGEASKASLYFEDSAATEQVLASLGVHPELRSAHVCTLDGERFASFSAGEHSPFGTPPKLVSGRASFGDQSLWVREPIVLDSEVIGTLDLELSTNQIDQWVKSFALVGSGVMLLAFLVAMGLSAVLRGVLVRPLLELAATARRVSMGEDYSIRVEDHGRDEVGDVATAFNSMLARVEERDAALRREKQRAEEATRAKSDFLANMSHEIRTPMNGVVSTAELLVDSGLNEEQLELANIVRSSGQSLLTIISDILDISKIEAGRLELERTEFDPAHVVEEICELLSAQAQGEELEIVHDIHPDVPATVLGDPTRIRQLLLNFANNAVKFTRRGSVVMSLCVESRDAGAVRLRASVKDTGIGIPTDRQDRLFRPFSQVDTSTTRVYGGTGLGLAIAKQLAEQMGGEVGVESEPGSGSEFWFTVELELGESEAATAARGSGDGGCALVLMASPPARKALTRTLEALGLEVHATGDPGEAQLLAADLDKRSQGHTVLVLDAHWPGLDTGVLARVLGRILKPSGTLLMSHPAQLSEVHSLAADLGAAVLRRPARRERIALAVSRALRGELLSEPSVTEAQGREAPLLPVAADTRVLLVEDNQVNQRIACLMLKRLGLECDVAVNGAEAVIAHSSERYALILMDCQMPEMDGFEATRRIRIGEDESSTHIPIIAMTANAMDGDRERCLAAGMDDYLSKPVDLALLEQRLARWLPELERGDTAA